VTRLSSRAKQRKLQKAGFEWKQGKKMEEADAAWASLAERINAGERESMLTILEKRGYVNQIAG
jgi:hypothetical protein